ncbi:MAG: hypothetical protein ACHQC8_07140 [Solirubrobacterales bacterium]
MKRLALVALFAFACGAVPAQAQTLSLGYHSGDTYKYSFHSTTKQTLGASGMTVPSEIDTSATETVKVKSVDSSGTADLAITLGNFNLKSTTGGVTNTTTGIADTTLDVSVAADGRVLSMNGQQFAGANPFLIFSGLGGGFFVSAVLPSSAVKPGDTWSKSYDQANPGGTGTVHLTTQSKYLRNETIQGVNAAVVETTSNGSLDMTLGAPAAGGAASGFGGMSIKSTLTSDVTTWIDPTTHRLLKTHSTETNDGTVNLDASASSGLPGLTGPITIKGTGTTDLNPA